MAEQTQDLDAQTEMAFMDDGLDRDPVSGNEIPTGSLANEVRDDVPAMLSEGEYVVPADVLRFFGVKFFEDLRMQAKEGLAQMEANGRIGGTPVDSQDMQQQEEEEELPIPLEELDIEEIQMSEGGLMDAILTYKTIVNNQTGETKSHPYVGDKPLSPLPEGFSLVSGSDVKPKETPEERAKRKDNKRDKLAFDKQKAETKRLYPDGFGTDRIPRTKKELMDYASQLKGTGIMNIGADDIITKVPVIGNLASAMLSVQHKDILEDAKEMLASGENLSNEEKSTLEKLLAGEDGLTPAKSFAFKAKDTISGAIKKSRDKKEKKKLMQDADDGVGAFRDLSKDKKGTGYKGGR